MAARPSLQTALLRVSVLALLLAPAVVWVLFRPPVSFSQSSSVLNFESPQVHPLALTPDGTRLLAVNSPNGTLSVFQLANGLSPKLLGEIPVGLRNLAVMPEPVP